MKNSRVLIKKITILIGVIIIPLAYSLFYLAAFWDPYSRLSDLPVAVVNLDKGALVNGQQRNLGDEMVQRMNDGKDLKWVFTSAQEASSGLNGKTYYATVTIPEDFSANIASAGAARKSQARILYSSNETRNFLATQILGRAMTTLEEQTRTSINREITQQLSDKLAQVPDKLGELNDGLSQLHDGAGKLNDGAGDVQSGANDLKAGAADVHDGSSQVLDGANQVKSGVNSLSKGIKDLDGGIKALQSGARDLNKGLDDLSSGLKKADEGAADLKSGAQGTTALIDGSAQLKTGAADLQSGVDQYVAGVNALIAQNQTTAQVLSTYAAHNPSVLSDPILGPLLTQLSGSSSQLTQLQQAGAGVQAGASQVAAASSQLAAGAEGLTQLQSGAADLSAATAQLLGGAQALDTGSATLLAGLNDAKSGSAKLVSDSGTLASGTADLANGAADLNKGTTDLSNGATDLAKGTVDLKDGTNDLLDGTGTAQGKVSDAIANAKEELKSTDGLAAFAENPVVVDDQPINPVPNYGTAFSPYFMSLSLWVGAIIMFVGIYLDPDNRFPSLGRGSRHRLARVAVFFCVGLAQSVSLAFLVIHGLHLTVSNIWTFYGSCVLVSVVFTSVVEFLIVNLGDAGKFLALLFLILQLTACGGTFPMETVPPFFQAIYRYMPMTYSVNLFKDVIGSVPGGGHNALILVGVFAVFTAMTMALDALRRNSRKGTPETLQAQ